MVRCWLVLTFVLLAVSCIAQQEFNLVDTCSQSNVYFSPELKRCVQCPVNSTYVAASSECRCNDGFAYNQFTMTCLDCVSNREAVATAGDMCLSCGFPNITANKTFVRQFLSNVSASYFDANTTTCQCPQGLALVEMRDSLQAFVCISCEGHLVNGKCIVCTEPRIYDESKQQCVCGSKTKELFDGRCASTALLDSLIPAGRVTTVTLNNVGNEGSSTTFTSDIMQRYLDPAALDCSNGNQTACSLLANLCVMTSYDLSSAPCAVYRALQLLESCRGLACEIPSTLPWLYYLRSSPLILQGNDITMTVSFEARKNHHHRLRFMLSTFALNGTWLGYKEVTTQFHMCDLSGAESLQFFQIGVNREIECYLDLRWFLSAPETTFYELFLLDDNDIMRDIPVLMEYGTKDLDPKDINDAQIAREGSSTDGNPTVDGYKRRFYMYDISATKSLSRNRVVGVTFARRVILLISLQANHLGKIYKPLLVIQYASSKLEDFAREVSTKYDEWATVRSAMLDHEASSAASMFVRFTQSSSKSEKALMITLITLCCLCFFTAWVRTYGWMRRQQEMIITLPAITRWFVYYCNHLSNMFAFVVVLTSGFYYILYKHQNSVEFLLPQNNKYLFAMLYTAVPCKAIVVLYKIFEQCNADIFVIDWERPKGGNQVTMWRSTFIANEFNELQTLRLWHPLFNMIIIMIFLEGFRYVNLARAIPFANINDTETSVFHPVLRVAVGCFYWIVVPGTFFFLEHYVYYRILAVHPLRGFIDLCSVANISLIILLEPLWGFYIHGESIHPHADASLEEFQDHLRQEAQGNLPQRGLGGQEDCQSFEVFIGFDLRQEIYACYADLRVEYAKGLRGEFGPLHLGHHRRCCEFMFCQAGQSQEQTDATLQIKQRLNAAFQRSAHAAETSLLGKMPMHALLDFPPNLLYMNGAFSPSKESFGRDIYFLDAFDGFSKSLLMGIDLDMWALYLLLFVTIDSSLMNTYVALMVCYILDFLLVFYRSAEGEANIGSKTLFDDRFFL